MIKDLSMLTPMEKAAFACAAFAFHYKYNTPAYYQEYLRGYYENDALRLLHIVGGVNLSNGYPYMAFGWEK